MKVKVALRSAAPAAVKSPSAVAAPSEILPIKSESAPKRPKTVKPPKEAAPLPTTPVVPSPVVLPAPTPAVSNELPTLSQPVPYMPAQVPIPVLPLIETERVPEVPPVASTAASTPSAGQEAKAFNDEPGKDVVVIALLLNDQGIVIDTRIAVPSRHVIEDLTLAFSVKGRKWSEVTPPLAPGEQRWVELRLPYDTSSESPSNLP